MIGASLGRRVAAAGAAAGSRIGILAGRMLAALLPRVLADRLLEADGLAPLACWLLVGGGGCVLAVAVVTQMSLAAQGAYGALTISALLVLRRIKNRFATHIIIVLSILVSTRYLWWRITETLIFEDPVGALLGIGLLCAEIYSWLILVLGHIQVAWPLNQPLAPLPDDWTTWPTVDVYIPAYNESLSVVESTVLAARMMDYPPDKFRVYILDDGRRPEFGEFARKAGVGYLTRSNNLHAKAGNLNAAMSATDGELIAIFDCDHIPTRSFLQFSVGWFISNPKLSLVQTPHHFYSPDPFERNLQTGKHVPNEGLLFYGLLQDGNDLWNAAFFCGSCAVLRRTAVQSIDGFATETVTEDAHTALKMHRKGWDTAYISLPMAAGLATERLAIHIGQRMRWARGMTQIFRIDNPVLGRGLKLGQRICYLNAMLHFFFGLPRFIFLSAPLSYLILHVNIIAASALAILAYAGPHLAHTILTNSRIQGNYRRSFWGEIYETMLFFMVIRPTFQTLIDPKKGKFNVTEKGGLLPESYFDYKVVRPHLMLISMLLAGIGFGVVRAKLAYCRTRRSRS